MAELSVPSTTVPSGGKAWVKWAVALTLTAVAAGVIFYGASKGWSKGKQTA